MPQENKPLNVLIMVKGDEKYCFTYLDDGKAAAHRMFINFANNPELSFDWGDVARMNKGVRELAAHK